MKVFPPLAGAIHRRSIVWLSCPLLAFSPLNATGENPTPRLVIPQVGGDQSHPSATLANFAVIGSLDTPVERTSLNLSYDNTHLYISGMMTAFALDATSNMSDSFKAAARKQDGDVLADDSVEMRFSIGDSANYLIAINALGTVLDMQRKGHWEKAWDGEIMAAAERGNGFWQFKVAIPWKSLEMASPLEEKTLRFSAVRFDSRSQERSVITQGEETTQLFLGSGGSSFAQVGVFKLPVTSTEKIMAKITSAKGKTLTWKSELLRGTAPLTEEAHSTIAASPEMDLGISAPSKKVTGATHFRFSIYAEGHPLYISPLYPYRDEREEIRITAEAKVPLSLYLNGKSLSTDSKGAAYAALEPGANVVAARIAAGSPLKMVIKGPNGLAITSSEPWKVALASESAASLHADDSKWETAPAPEGRSIASLSKEGDVIFRKTILHRSTRLTPQFLNGICRLAQGSAQFFHWDGGGLEHWNLERPLQGFQLVIEVPKGIEFLGASGYRPPLTAALESGLKPPAPVTKYHWLPDGEITHGTTLYHRYRIDRDSPVFLTDKKESWQEGVERRQNGLAFAIRASKDTPLGSLPPIYYWAESDGGTLLETPNRLQIDLHPALDSKSPEKIALSLYTRGGLIDDKKLLESYYDTIKSSGINEVFGETHSAYPRMIGLKQTSYFNFGLSSRTGFGMGHVMIDSLLRTFPEAQAIAFDGRRMPTPCFSWLARHEEAWPLIEQEIAGIARRNPSMTHLFWDYEFPPFPEGLHAYPMFSSFGIETFKKAYHIEQPLTPTIIHEQYTSQWVEFTCGEVATVVTHLRQLALKQGLQLTMYSGYEMPYTHRRYNVDWSKVGPHLDRAYCGYTNDKELIAATRSALGSVPLAGALLYQGSAAPRHSPAAIVRKLVDHGGGVLFWYESDGFDEQTLGPIAESSRFACNYEQIILNGKRVDQDLSIPTASRDGVVALQYKDQILLVLLNDRESPRTFRFELPEGMERGPGAEPMKASGRSIAETLPAGAFRAFAFRTQISPN